MSNPTKVKTKNDVYEINSDFRIAIKCDEISRNQKISDYEKTLAIIYLLFGEKGLNAEYDYNELIQLAIKFLTLGKGTDENKNIERDFDLIQDEGYIKSSFKYDYQYDPYTLKYLHWWDYYNDLANLSNNEFGSCCILSRIRNIRNFDTSTIKDSKERQKAEEVKKSVQLKKTETVLTEKQKRSAEKFNKLVGLK